MKKIGVFFLSIFIFVFSSCSKDKMETKFYGKVYDQTTGAILPDVTINTGIFYSAKFSGGSEDRDGGNGTANAAGNFSYIINDEYNRQEVDKRYVVTVHSNQWNFSYTYHFIPAYGEHNEVHHDIPVVGIGLIHVIAHNTNPFDANDNIGSFYQTTAGDLGALPSYGGMNVNDTFAIQGFSGPRTLHSTIVKNNITTNRIDTITIPGFSEGYYHLDY